MEISRKNVEVFYAPPAGRAAMKKLSITAMVLLLALLVIPHFYVHSRTGGPGQILWNDRQCFIFLQTNHSGWRFTPLQYITSAALELLGRHTDSTDSDADVQVVHLHDGKIDSHTVRHFELSTTVLPNEGQLYLLYYKPHREGGQVTNEARNFRWSGESFVSISEEDANRVRASFRGYEDVLRKEGWSSRAFDSSFSPGKLEVSLPDGTYVIELQRPSEAETVVVLRGPSTDRTLAKYQAGRPHFVAGDEFRSIFTHKP